MMSQETCSFLIMDFRNKLFISTIVWVHFKLLHYGFLFYSLKKSGFYIPPGRSRKIIT